MTALSTGTPYENRQEAQSDFRTLPPCRFTISKREQQGQTGSQKRKKQHKTAQQAQGTAEIMSYRHDFEKDFCQGGNNEAGLQAALPKFAGATHSATDLIRNQRAS